MEPKLVFDYFAQINEVPRPSKHEEKIIAWLEKFAAENNISCKKDHVGNILYTVPATAGMEQKPTVIFQAHMDMVCEKSSDREIDFMNDPILTYIDGDWMRAKGTTLGADDGLGIAMALAFITDPKVEHGPIECLFTIDEETGLTGAFELQSGFMNGKYLINLDSEDEGEIFIGCAGGANTTIACPAPLVEMSKKYFAVRIAVDGLRGGHSGDDINKHRLNANKALVRFISEAMHKYDLQLCDIQAGGLHNAIPRHAEAVIAVPFPEKENLRVDFNIFASELEAEWHDEEKMRLTLESEADVTECIEQQSARNIISALMSVHNGVYEMSIDLPGLVETSSNLASIKLIKDERDASGSIVKIVTSQRSSIGSQRKVMSAIIRAPFELIGAECVTGEGYPGWKPNPDSHLLKVAVDEYKKMFNKEPKVKAIHAGLECGLFSEKYPGLDMISVGPTLRGVHSPDECLLIPTVQMVYDHIVAILKAI